MLKKSMTLLLLIAITAAAYTTIGTTRRSDATGYSNQQKLDRVVNTNECHTAWQTRNPSEDEGLFHSSWRYFQDGVWSMTYTVPTIGLQFDPYEEAYPFIATTSYSDVFFAYLATEDPEIFPIEPPPPENPTMPALGEWVVAAVAANDNGTYRKFATKGFLQSAGIMASPPSLAIQEFPNPGPNEPFMVAWLTFIEHNRDGLQVPKENDRWACWILTERLLVYDRDDPKIVLPDIWSFSHLDFIRYNQEPFEPEYAYHITNVSTEVDAMGKMHFAYLKKENDVDRLYYGWRNYDGQLVGNGPVPLPFFNVQQPQISCFGDSAYIVFREVDAQGINHIRRISHWLGDSLPPNLTRWPGDDELDFRGDQYARSYPYCRGKTVVWQENYTSYPEILDPALTVVNNYPWVSPVNDDAPARFANVDPWYFYPGYTWHFALWTEKDGADYDVRFGIFDLTPTMMSTEGLSESIEIPVYLGILGGAEPQPYALKRERALHLRGHSLDYHPSELAYDVSYLAPPYDYYARIVVSVPTDPSLAVAGREKVLFDGIEVGELTLGSGSSDTVYVQIPLEAYAKDRSAVLTLKGVNTPALLEEFTTYRFETEPAEAQGSSAIDETPLQAKIKLWAAQTSDGVTVYYTLSEPSRVAVEVFDCSGRCVSSNEVQGVSGVNSLILDKQRMSAGVYFIRVSTHGESATCKTINLH